MSIVIQPVAGGFSVEVRPPHAAQEWRSPRALDVHETASALWLLDCPIDDIRDALDGAIPGWEEAVASDDVVEGDDPG